MTKVSEQYDSTMSIVDRKADTYIDLVDIVYQLIDHVIYIVLAAIIGGIVVGQIEISEGTSYYSATSKIYLMGANTENNNIQQLSIADDLMGDYIAAFSNLELHERIIDTLDLSYSPTQLMSMVSVSNQKETHILEITVMANDSAEETKLLADTYAEVVGDFFVDKFCYGETSIFEYAKLPQESVIKAKRLSPVIGVFVGGILAAAIIIIIFMFDDKIRYQKDVIKCLDIPVIGIMTDQSLPIHRKIIKQFVKKNQFGNLTIRRFHDERNKN